MTKRTPKKPRTSGAWVEPFLHNLRNTANVRAACNAAGVGRTVVYNRRDSHPDFAARWDQAMEEACDILEHVARKRAFETSDTLLIFLLKAHRPERFADRLQVEYVIRKRAQKLADRFGMTAEEVVAQAESVLRGNGRN